MKKLITNCVIVLILIGILPLQANAYDCYVGTSTVVAPPGVQKLGSIVLFDQESSKFPANASLRITLPSQYPFTDVSIKDVNSVFDWVYASRINADTFEISWGNRMRDSKAYLFFWPYADLKSASKAEDIVAVINSSDLSINNLDLYVAKVAIAPPPYVPIFPREALDQLMASGKMSNNDIHTAILDLSNLNNGSVAATVYETAYEKQTVNIFNNITPQPIKDCPNKITRYIFELTNRYRPLNTDYIFGFSNNDACVTTYVYGQYKDQAMYAFLSGIPDCLNNVPYNPPSGGGGGGGNDGSWIDKYSPDKTKDKQISSFKITQFTLDSNKYTTADITTTNTENFEEKVIDVAPYIKDNRTYVPVRYLAYSLGVLQDGVVWDGSTQQVGIIKDDTQINLTIGNATMTVNEEPVTMDVAPEITNNRTFLPVRWVAEALGATVEWNDSTRQATIKMPIEKPGN